MPDDPTYALLWFAWTAFRLIPLPIDAQIQEIPEPGSRSKRPMIGPKTAPDRAYRQPLSRRADTIHGAYPRQAGFLKNLQMRQNRPKSIKFNRLVRGKRPIDSAKEDSCQLRTLSEVGRAGQTGGHRAPFHSHGFIGGQDFHAPGPKPIQFMVMALV